MTPVDGSSLREPNRRTGWLFAAVWLVFLVYPITVAWDLDNPTERAFALVAIAVFAVIYMVAFYLFRTRSDPDYPWPRPRPGSVWAAIAALLVVLVAAAFVLHADAFSLGIYVVSLAAFMFPTRAALSVVLGLVAAVLIVPRLLGWETEDLLAFQLAVAAFAAWGVSQVLLRNRQLAAAREQLADLAIAEERLRVGRDVHDILGHSLTVITIKTQLASRLLDVDVEKARSELIDIERLARDALAGVRETVGGLRAVTLAGEIANARTALSAAGIRADLPETVDVSGLRGQVFGWVLREAVTNVVRHSGAASCVVRVSPDRIEISDDGAGFTGSTDSAGAGLRGLAERVAGAGGSLQVGTSPSGGARVVAEFPAGPET